jgi:predicted aconitase with swiveling domain
MIQGRALHAGLARGEVVRLNAPLSFWGGFDAETGRIIDRAHPQFGQSLAGKIVVMPGSRGSSATPGVLAESIRRGTGPAGLIVTKADINLTAGALVAKTLYGKNCPIVLVDNSSFDLLIGGTTITVEESGALKL